jgi:microcin C transport system substrate-binding protein
MRRIFNSGLKNLSALAALCLLAAIALPSGAEAQEEKWRHGTSLLGEVKYPQGFTRFDYVNPDAPKGGQVRFAQNGTFDTLNPILPKGNNAIGLGHIYEPLMTKSMDEQASEYGLLAEAMRYPDDYSSVTYRLRENARWHDGKPVTPEDVVWSFNMTTELDPQRRFYYKHVKSAEKTADREVTFTFDQIDNRELPHIVGQLLILPKHWWEGTDAKGNKRNIRASTLEAPVGSGPYKVQHIDPGRTITYERAENYWGRDVNVNIGYNNFDVIKYEYFRNDTAEFEAFKSGAIDWREENTAKVWATQYDFPAIKSGQVVKNIYENRHRTSGLMVGFMLNLRDKKFENRDLRLALNYGFNFEELNRSLFYGQYSRIGSYFYGNELASAGLPEGKELDILKSVKAPIPDEVLTTVFTNPVGETRTDDRNNRRQALRLLKQAGYEVKGGWAIDPTTGKPLTIELILNGPSFEPLSLRYKDTLKRIGVNLKIRILDSSQYIARLRNRDFEMIYSGWGQSLSPGNEQFDYFGSAAADKNSSRNYAGIKNPAVDELINKVVFAKNREDLIAATKALDRVLLWNHYVVPGWTLRASRIARWDKFSHPDPLPQYAIGFPSIWWYDDGKAAAVSK